jgi:antitoxin ParD1/3/4
MATMNISLPDKMKKWVEKQVKTGRYANASDYIRDLIRDEQDGSAAREAAQREFDALIEEALATDPIDADLEEARLEVKRELGNDKSDAA